MTSNRVIRMTMSFIAAVDRFLYRREHARSSRCAERSLSVLAPVLRQSTTQCREWLALCPKDTSALVSNCQESGHFVTSAELSRPQTHIKIAKNRSRLELRRHFFPERVINRWNSLDQRVIDATSMNALKNGLGRLRKKSIGFLTDWTSAWP